MEFAHRNKFLAATLCIFSRLYFLSVLGVIFVLIGDIFDLESWSAYNHQAIGGMLLAGGLWISSLAVHAVLSVEIAPQIEQELQSNLNYKEVGSSKIHGRAVVFDF